MPKQACSYDFETDPQARYNSSRLRGWTSLVKLKRWQKKTNGRYFIILDTNRRNNGEPDRHFLEDVIFSSSEDPENVMNFTHNYVIPSLSYILSKAPPRKEDVANLIDYSNSKGVGEFVDSRVDVAHVNVGSSTYDPVLYNACQKNSMAMAALLLSESLASLPGSSGENAAKCIKKATELYVYRDKNGAPITREEVSVMNEEPEICGNYFNHLSPKVMDELILNKKTNIMTPFSVGKNVDIEKDGRVVYLRPRVRGKKRQSKKIKVA